VDIGGTLASGYHSDCTRTYVVGGDISQAPEDFLKAYQVLKDAQQASLDFAKPGRTAEEIDASSRTPITQAGYGEYFTHRLGHGIGLSGHEEPLSSRAMTWSSRKIWRFPSNREFIFQASGECVSKISSPPPQMALSL